VLCGGSHNYIPPLTAPYRDILLDAGIRSVSRQADKVSIHFDRGGSRDFDHVVFACHGDQVLPLLDNPTAAERDVLQRLTTSRNEAVLHTDQSLLPRRPRARAAWNYHLALNGRNAATLTYDMNRLQSLDVPEHYCVTLNGGEAIDPASVIARIIYHHPLYNRPAIEAQSRWKEVSGVNRTHYCGAYWFYGFHEDGLNSALRVARSLGVDC
jgi:uncharacterized protein